MSEDISGAIAKAVLAIVSIVFGVCVYIHAYGLTIESWPWLVFGTIGQLVLLAAAGAWSKK